MLGAEPPDLQSGLEPMHNRFENFLNALASLRAAGDRIGRVQADCLLDRFLGAQISAEGRSILLMTGIISRP